MFTINETVFKEVKGKVERLAKQKKTMPILHSVLVEVEEHEVHFTASNGSDTVRHSVSVEDGIVVKEIGSFLLPTLAIETISKLKDVEIIQKDDQLVITEVSSISKKKRNTFNFAKLGDANDFPKLIHVNTKKEHKVVLKGPDFQHMIQKVLISVSKNDSRPILTGVNMKFSAESTQFISTDSFKLTKVNTKGFVGENDEISIVVPESSLSNMLKALDFDKDLVLYPSDNSLVIQNGSTLYVSRLLEGNFPDTSRLIPNHYKSKVALNKNELLNSLEVLNVVGTTSVMMDIDSLFVSLSSNNELVKTSQELAHEAWESDRDKFSIAFNIEFLMNMLKVMDTQSVSLEFTEALRPILVKYRDEDEQDTIDEFHLLLPVRSAQ